MPFVPFISPLRSFPKSDPTVQLLNTAGVFAAGFFMRPLGGWLFGRIADKRGRKNAMVTSVVMMCVGSLAIAFLPTYASIGVFAPALLLVARLFQGLSVGGEYGTTATYMSEIAMRGRRGFFSSFQYVTLIGGQLLAVLVVVILQQLLEESRIKAWGWRIPFLIGAITAIVAMVMRKTLSETTNVADQRGRKPEALAHSFVITNQPSLRSWVIPQEDLSVSIPLQLTCKSTWLIRPGCRSRQPAT